MTVARKHDRDTPRPWFGLYLRLGGWISLIAGFLLLVLSLISDGFERSANRFQTEGRVAWATVTDKRTEVTRDADGDTHTSYFVAFRFDTRVGQTIETERQVARRFWQGTFRGEEKQIRYLPDAPQTIEYWVGEKARNARILFWIAGIFGTVGLSALWYIGRLTNRAMLARRDGEKQVAEVVEIKELSISVNKKRQARLVWIGPDRKVGKSLMRNYSDLRHYAKGDNITVFRRGKDAWWEGDVGPRRGNSFEE